MAEHSSTVPSQGRRAAVSVGKAAALGQRPAEHMDRILGAMAGKKDVGMDSGQMCCRIRTSAHCYCNHIGNHC